VLLCSEGETLDAALVIGIREEPYRFPGQLVDGSKRILDSVSVTKSHRQETSSRSVSRLSWYEMTLEDEEETSPNLNRVQVTGGSFSSEGAATTA